jgi:hypothetical protein
LLVVDVPVTLAAIQLDRSKEAYLKYVRLWLILATALGSVLAFACGGSSNNDNGSTPGPTASSTNANGASNTPSGNGGTSLSDLVNNVSTKPIKASYSFSAGGTTETFTMYNKPPNRRVDVTVSGETIMYISSDGKDYICSATDQSCRESPLPLTSTLPFFGFFTNPQALSGLVGSGLDHSTKTIAGEDADCYSASAQSQTGEVCFNHDGILVSISGGGITMEATSVSGTVADSDLTLPYPVQ